MTPEFKHLEADEAKVTPAMRDKALEQLFGQLHTGNAPNFIKENIQRNNELLRSLTPKDQQ